MMNWGKYEFDTKEICEAMILGLGVEINEEGLEVPSHNHAIIPIGNIQISPPIFDENGITTQEAVDSLVYRIDVAWYGLETHPSGWDVYAVDVPSGSGVSEIDGINYQDYKFQAQ